MAQDGDTRRSEVLARPHGELIVLRLHTLVQAGYRADLGNPGADIDLAHPQAPPVALSGDGIVRDDRYPRPVNEAEIIWIEADDSVGSQAFIESVPKLTLWQQIKVTPSSEVVGTAWAMAAAILTLIVAGWSLESLVRFVWRLVTGR